MKKIEALIIIFLLIVLGALGYLLYYFYTTPTEEPPLPDKFESIVKSVNEIQSDEKLYVKIKVDYVNVRKINVVSEDNIIGLVAINDIYLVRDIKKGSDYYWYLIEDEVGHLGYIPSGSDSLYVDTYKIKGDVDVSLSKISNYVEGEQIIVPTTSLPISTTIVPKDTSSTTTSSRTTTCSRCATKTLPTTTTTTTSTKTTKTTKTTGKTIVISTTTSEPLLLGLYIAWNGNSIYAMITNTQGGKEPYTITLSLSKDGVLLDTTDGETIVVPAEVGTYTIYGKVVDANGLEVEDSKDFTIKEI